MKYFKNKKGIMHAMIWWFFYVMITLFVYFTLKSYTVSILIDKTSTHNMEYTLMNNQIIEGLSYNNLYTNRIELGIIDANKFNNDLFKTIEIPPEMNELGIKIILIKKGKEKTISYNEGYHNKFYELRDFSHKLWSTDNYILVKDNDHLENGKLTVSILARKKR
jgi:hypothetical protein